MGEQTDATSKPLSLDRDQMRVKVTFGKSSSPKYKGAVLFARELPGYKCHGEAKDQVHVVDVQLSFADVQLWEEVLELASIVGTWKKSEVIVEGAPADTFWNLKYDIAIRD